MGTLDWCRRQKLTFWGYKGYFGADGLSIMVYDYNNTISEKKGKNVFDLIKKIQIIWQSFKRIL